MNIKINKTNIGSNCPVYFIADIASNHCGDLGKAKELVYACAEAGANAVKMQNFSAATIVSDFGFKALVGVTSHQSRWEKSVYDSYEAASIPLGWTVVLRDLCDSLGLDYFTSPYSFELTRAVTSYVSAFKVGSGDITWHESLELMASYSKPVLLATGASSFAEVRMAMDVLLAKTKQIILMQCNTDYTAHTGEAESEKRARFHNLNLKVLETYSKCWPDIPVGLSDHTQGSLAVLAAVGLFGCSVVEKHFTLDNSLEGQDHAFSMTPATWLQMVNETSTLRIELNGKPTFEDRFRKTAAATGNADHLALAIGDGIKKVEENERATVVVQRRAIRSSHQLQEGLRLTKGDLCVLRPCPSDALPPYRLGELVGKILRRNVPAGDCVRLDDVVEEA